MNLHPLGAKRFLIVYFSKWETGTGNLETDKRNSIGSIITMKGAPWY